MKRLIGLLAAASVILGCTACGTKDTSSSDSSQVTGAVTKNTEATAADKTEETQKAAPISGGSFSAEDACVSGSAGSVTIDQDASSLPAADSVDVSPSCYYEGDDKIFHYGDMDVYTYPSNGSDYVLEVDVLSEGASTAGGLTVGMSIDDAVAIYGEGTDSGSMYKWDAGNIYMYAAHSGGTITSIGIAKNN